MQLAAYRLVGAKNGKGIGNQVNIVPNVAAARGFLDRRNRHEKVDYLLVSE